MRSPFFLIVIQTAIPALPTPASGGRGTLGVVRNRNHSPQSARIKTVADPVTGTVIRITMGNVISPGRGTSDMVQTEPVDILHDAGTMTMSAAAPTSTERSCRHDNSFDDRKVKQRHGTSASPPRGQRWAHTPEHRPLPPPLMLHSTPLAISLKPASVESVPARLSFDQSQCSLPPLDLGEEDARSLPSMGVPTPAATLSMASPIPPPSTSASALHMTADHTKIIFNLACEGQHLKERVTREFIKLSSREVLFRTQAQSTSHEALASARPDRFSTFYQTLQSDEEPSDACNKAMEEIVDAVNKAWSRANETLFNHVLDYEGKLNAFLDKVGGWIREQEEHVWTTVFQIVEDTGAPVCALLNILFCLLDTLPSLPPNPSYQSQSPLTCGFSPAAYAQPWLGLHNLNLPHTPSFDGGRKARDVLKDAIIRSSQGRPVSKARVIPAASTSTAPVHISKDAETIPSRGLPACSPPAVHSPSKRKCTRSPSPQRSQSGTSSSGSSVSGRESRGSHSSSSSLLGSSSGSGSGSGSQSGSPARSEASVGARSVHSAAASVWSIKVLSGDQASEGEHDVSYSTNEADVSQGSIPLLDISASDDDETRKCKAHDYACRSDTAYAAWKEKQTSDGVKGIEERDQMVNDYTGGKRRPKNPDPLGPPVSYMEDRGVFQPLTSPTNTFGLCRFYRTDPNAPMPSGPVSPATAEHVKRLVLLASMTPQQYVLMVFQGGTVTALGLLQELHTWSVLVWIPIYQSGDTKDGHGTRVSCCPFCTYTVQNDPAYLNHIVCAHYDSSFRCGSCLSAITSSVQKMKDHIKECSGLTPLPTPSQESVPGGCSPKKGVPESKHVSSKKKSSRSEKSQLAGQASQDSQASDRHVTRATGASQETPAKSTRCRTQHKKKAKKKKSRK